MEPSGNVKTSIYKEPVAEDWKERQLEKAEEDEAEFFEDFQAVYPKTAEGQLEMIVDEVLKGMDIDTLLNELNEYAKWEAAFSYMKKLNNYDRTGN